ncbi:MAG: glycosyltransferase family 2 protein [Thermodesulfobacteriota bacterium]|nr:glycosyltransferase family 2 protein [Thermodesulfobacteriota bacterium]
MISIDIIIVNYNSTDHLLRCLRSVFDDLNGAAAKIFVQDNASEDNVDRLNEIFPTVRLCNNGHNIGFSKAVNKALKISTAEYVLVLNPDTYLFGGFFEPVVGYMDRHPDVGILGPRILNSDGSLQGSARSHPSALTAFFGRSSVLSKWFPSNRVTRSNLLTSRSDGVNPMEADWVSGACMLVRREAVKDVGLMDERFFMYWEDADWCRRMRAKGWKVVYFPRISIVHYVGASSEKFLFRPILEFHKSSYRLFDKYNKPSLWFLKPLVIAGLSIRIPFVLAVNRIRVWSGR